MEVAHWQQFRFPLFQPFPGIVTVALGAASVFAGMVGIVEVAAVVIAFRQMPPQCRGATVLYG